MSELSLFSLSSSFLKRFTTGRSSFLLYSRSSFLPAAGPVQITLGRARSVLAVGLEPARADTLYSDTPDLDVGDGRVVSVMKVGEVVVSETRGDVGLEAIAAS